MPAWQGLWNQEQSSQAGYSYLVNKNPRRNSIRRSMNREGFRVITALFNSLVGAAAGGATGAITHRRIANPSTPVNGSIPDLGDFGGLRTIQTVTDINRVTTAADVTALKEMVFNVKTRPATYPRDRSGNGGPQF